MKLNLSRILPALAFVLGLSLSTQAQQIVCLSVHGGPATGVNSSGAASSLSARLNVGGGSDTTSTAPGAGQGAGAASAAHQAAFAAKGYATTRTNATEFCIIAGPGGAPINEGVVYGNDDTGLDIDSAVHVPAPPAPAADPATKKGGGGIGGPPVNQPPIPLPQPAVIIIIIEIEDSNGNVTVIRVVIVIQPGMNGQQILQAIEQALRQAGLLPNRARWQSPLGPGQWVDGFQVDRTVAGGTVHHMEYQYDALSRRVMRQEMTAGMLPTYGTGSYGACSRGAASADPWAHANGAPLVNSFFDITYEMALPNAPGGELVSLSRPPFALPLFGGHVLVDLNGALFTFALTDAAGRFQRHYMVPNNTGLVGLPLHCQGLCIEPVSGRASATDAVRAVVMQ